jgi:hypothetical protein
MMRGGKRDAHRGGGREIHIACGTYGEKRDTYSVLVGKPKGRRPLRRLKRRWKNNIETDLQELLPEVLTVINLA